ncbi:carbohydrate-binding family 9-like protein [Pararhodonellum marinum]|uniref:carbohydrate-binding family 9-like protein n=1 Tax=Pararhodonellum marinum TaxID=2755358 RepID=UPI0018908FD9|nr:carbohydrate-binding family 9-like protein [Pararhodonellum marinum]
MKVWIFVLACLLHSLSWAQQASDRQNYVAYRSDKGLIMDGKLEESDWQLANWSVDFVDIEGQHNPAPAYATRMKMLWDADYLYLGIWMEEPHLWAKIEEDEQVIYYDPDIEVFIDPDGDTHFYYELEINALGAVWDLLMSKPYRNGGKAINGWDIKGLKKGIHLEGTLNDPTDKDAYWSVELAIPWKALSQQGPNFSTPKDGEQWRINFSRVHWEVKMVDGDYQKVRDSETGKPLPEHNWVWSPQGLINMHVPENWGFVQFVDAPVGSQTVVFQPHPDEYIKDELRVLYHLQHAYAKEHGHFAFQLNDLPMPNQPLRIKPEFEVSKTRFKISAPSNNSGQIWHITEDSRIWKQ